MNDQLQNNSRQVKFDLNKPDKTKFLNIDEFIYKNTTKLGNILTRNFLSKSIFNMSNSEDVKEIDLTKEKITESIQDKLAKGNYLKF